MVQCTNLKSLLDISCFILDSREHILTYVVQMFQSIQDLDIGFFGTQVGGNEGNAIHDFQTKLVAKPAVYM